MPVVDVLNSKAEKVSQVELSDKIFDIPAKVSVLHEVVTMQLAKRRSGTASVKHRSDVKGSGRKLFKQKGTGRARRGDIKAPLLRGGGSVFGPDPRTYAYKVPKKVRRLALKMALSCKYKDNELVVLNKFELNDVKTKKFIEVIAALNIKKALIVTADSNANLRLSSRNVPYVKVLSCEGLNVYDILQYENLVLLEPAIEKIEERLI